MGRLRELSPGGFPVGVAGPRFVGRRGALSRGRPGGYRGGMLRLLGPCSALAASLLLAGCYVGVDLEGDTTGTGASASASATTTAATSSADLDTGVTTGDAGGGTTTGSSTTASASDGADTSTGGLSTTEPITSGPMTGDAQTSSSASTGDTGLPPPVDVPDNAYCVPVGDWDPGWAQLELDVLELVNQARAAGADCHSKGVFAATGPLTMDPALRCAARKHSADMAARDFFDHTNPDGETPWDRMAMAGYGDYSNAGENIAAGSPDAQGTMNQWLGSDGHCANIMSPNFTDIGVGYSPGGQYGHLWTQDFGAK